MERSETQTPDLKTLFREILNSKKAGQKRALSQDMRDYLAHQGITIRAEYQERPNANILLVICPNHHARSGLLTTMESFNTLAACAVSAQDLALTDKHTAWVIKHLRTYPFGPGALQRRVQNAAAVTYDAIAVRVGKKLVKNGLLPKLKDSLLNRPELVMLIATNVKDGNNLGFFPEQKPTHELQTFHKNFPQFLNALKLLADEVQILPSAVHFEASTAIVNFRTIIRIGEGISSEQAAQLTMERIALGLPASLRGPYL